MARLAVKSSAKTGGFVLSFSTFALAIFLVVFAQLQYSHLQTLSLDASDIHQISTPARVLRDLALDFNTLTGQTISIDQNSDTAFFIISGKRPNALSVETNLLRYQSKLVTFGRDANTSVFLDLNQTIADENFWGRTNHGVRWFESLNENKNKWRLYPGDVNFYPAVIDVNIVSEWPYDDFTIVNSGSGTAQTTAFNFNYTDTNASHTQTVQMQSLDPAEGTSFDFEYTVNGLLIISHAQIGAVEESSSSLPFGVTIYSDSNAVTWHYSISYQLPSDANGTRAGYDINTSIRGSDMNIDTNTIWTFGG